MHSGCGCYSRSPCQTPAMHSTLPYGRTNPNAANRTEENPTDPNCGSVKNLLATRAVRFVARAAEEFFFERRTARQAGSQEGVFRIAASKTLFQKTLPIDQRDIYTETTCFYRILFINPIFLDPKRVARPSIGQVCLECACVCVLCACVLVKMLLAKL